MRKYIVIISPPVVLIALLLLFISANEVDQKVVSVKEKSVAVSFQQVPPEERPVSTAISGEISKLDGRIKEYFRRAIKKRKIIGVAIAIVKCDSIIYTQGFGNKDAKLKDTIDAETIFRIGSVSKGFAGILTGMHVQEGKLNWDDKIIEHIPEFTMANKEMQKKVTLSQVLSHTSGLPYHSFTNLIEDRLSLSTIASRFNEVLPLQQPGSSYNYQNAAFALSGEIIERATGRDLSGVLKKKIFDPLKMHTASSSYEALMEQDNVAQPHYRRYGRWKKLKIHKKYYNAIAAGGVNASVTDMAKWMKFLLGSNPEVMSNEAMQQVFEPIIQVGGRRQYYQRWPGYMQSHYGHGWRVHTFFNNETNQPNTVIHHGGHVNNFRSELAVYPQEDLGICILFNSPTKLARTCIADIYKIIKEEMNRDKEMIHDLEEKQDMIVEDELQQMNYF